MWRSHWLANQTVHVKPFFPHIGVVHVHGLMWPPYYLYRDWPLNFQRFADVGPALVMRPIECLLAGYNYASHWFLHAWAWRWLAHESSHVKPLFCHILALHGFHIDRPMKLPLCCNCFSRRWDYMGFTLWDSFRFVIPAMKSIGLWPSLESYTSSPLESQLEL